MRYSLIASLLAVLALGGAASVHASYYDPNFTLKNDSQCVGGTLIEQFSDVQDTGGAVNAKPLATLDCQLFMTGPGQCCQVQYRRGTPAPPAIGSHVFQYQIYSGATVGSSVPPTGTLTNYYQHWAGVSGSGQCGGTWQLDYTDLSDLSCPVNLSQINIYKNVPTCPTNPGACTSGICKVNSIAESGASCVVQTDIYNCADSNGAPISASCTSTPPPVTAALVANPTSVVRGESALLTWSSQNAHTCSSTDFETNGLTSGSTVVTPQQSTTYKISCMREGGGTAQAQASVSVSNPSDPEPDFQVSCRAHPTQANIGEDVLWSSTVTGGEGTYTYSWSGSEGLEGTENQIFKQYSLTGLKTASLTVTYTSNIPQAIATPQPPEPPPPVAVPPMMTLPPGTACPAIGWMTPVTPCSGVWAPTYNTGGCQSGWQCIAISGGGGSGGGTLIPQDTSFLDSLQNLLNFESPTIIQGIPEIQTVDGSVLAAIATTVTHTEGELFTSQPAVKADMLAHGGVNFSETTFINRTLASDQVTMNRVCSIIHGAGSTATQIGARSYSSCSNNSIIKFDGTNWASVSGCVGAHLSGSFSCVVPAAPPPPSATPQCTLSVSPSTVQAGQSAILSWTSSGVSSLSINNNVGSVTPVTSGSRVVTPSASVTFSGTGSNSGTSVTAPATTVAHTESQAYLSPAVIADMQASGINLPAVQGNTGFSNNQVTMNRVCVLLDGPGSTATNIGARSYSSPGNNGVVSYNGTGWVRTAGVSVHMSTSFSCVKPGTTSTTPGSSVQCGGNAAITVVQPSAEPRSITVQCENSVQIGNAQCSDGLDNDGDGYFDYGDDPDCTGPDDDDESFEDEVYAPQCSDGKDNDGDGKIDYANKISGVANDPGCDSPTDEDERDHSTPQCSDGIDNDGDGLSDAQDPGCGHGGGSGGGGGGGGGYDPNDNSEAGGNSPQCSDGIDNNGDGNVDFPDDLGCSSADDNLEAGESGDLSFVATPPLIKKGQSCTLQLSARNVTSCSLTGPGVSRGFTATAGIVSVTQVVTPTLAQTSTYKLSCNSTSGKITSKTVDCKVAPTFEEF